mmetsp:Transcript_109675/g.318727  ORF Transcript_109675/g.318727 Transcript_109675/m.318727 type:complete len:392 (+) Transcript_109675:904-2079(+)
MYIRANTKNCPKCNQQIQKDEGCQHMRCTKCNYHFCWLCLGNYKDHSDKTGGFFSCNKFETRLKEEGRTAEEKVAMKAARQLKNYEMAFERYLNHKNAMETASKDLQKAMESSLRNLADDGVEDLHQLRSAVDQVITSRGILAWSYVFKFYEFEDDSLERELQLFETLQGKLEHMTEDLQSRLTEVESHASAANSSALVSAAASSPSSSPGLEASGGGGSGVGKGKKPEVNGFQQWRQGVVHLMGAVRSFSGQVVDFANNTDLYGAVEWEFREKDEAQETDAPRVVWAWKDDSTTWNPFSDENIRIIEEAHQASESTVRITSGGRRYQVLFRTTSTLQMQPTRIIDSTVVVTQIGDTRSAFCAQILTTQDPRMNLIQYKPHIAAVRRKEGC